MLHAGLFRGRRFFLLSQPLAKRHMGAFLAELPKTNHAAQGGGRYKIASRAETNVNPTTKDIGITYEQSRRSHS
jgi:hypothetical protein